MTISSFKGFWSDVWSGLYITFRLPIEKRRLDREPLSIFQYRFIYDANDPSKYHLVKYLRGNPSLVSRPFCPSPIYVFRSISNPLELSGLSFTQDGVCDRCLEVCHTEDLIFKKYPSSAYWALKPRYA